MDSVKSKKPKSPVAQTPKSAKKNTNSPAAQTPKSAKKNANNPGKTPVSKNAQMVDTPRPVLSNKKQNGLQAAGKPTPNKKGGATPNKTKTPKSEPKKKNKTPVKKVEDDDEEKEEDEGEDSEIEFNPELMKSLAEMSSDDEEDMDEDDDDDDDDDDELIDEEELKKLIMALKAKDKKSKNGVKETPKKEASKEPAAKGGKKNKGASPAAQTVTPASKKQTPKQVKQTPKEVKQTKQEVKQTKKESPAPKKEALAAKAVKKEQPISKKESPKEAKKEISDAGKASLVAVDKEQQIKSVYERDVRTLFLKGLPIDIQEEAIMKFSSDIRSVRIRKRIRRDPKKTACYAFLEFESEAIAEKNFKVLGKTVVGGTQLTVDYTGQKSLNRPKKSEIIKELDPTKLYITGFPFTTTETEMNKLFPKAESVIMPIKRVSRKPLGFAFAKFENADVCADELKRCNGKLFKECKLVVLYANSATESPKSAGVKRKTETVTRNAKKVKLEKAVEEVDDDEEDDDDDDEEDDDEEDDDEEDDDDEDDDDDDEEEEDEEENEEEDDDSDD